ncbi:hypothetical protein GE21DRAFT_3756 [Neurospora crassa]|uniref:Uncharacterized protein n=1 Tax=Neurospora crassa (strain ATCC 24698 / 74-OR23-1A / CBS 708.71 / DSM 1257 / FGSC 987) TaxID=367110 RepID=V5IQD1_NEUCR|nr:hypothetical protein NCU09483 [Neurospora crassa OR74A]ESA43739.1 hypothetical protein NCU09483 [Neurospora crassa OR74A]KHE83343.1 hypothetical protein GE21DRAFT_3756 [Neurospora crassa]|eukprot:XP_011393641.1 hypothetical protein NCU09483 [Neurospora crassa OR74A]
MSSTTATTTTTTTHNNMTDEELDRDWKPNGRRPQSTIARNFSQELMDIFRIDKDITDLDDQVDKRSVSANANAKASATIDIDLDTRKQEVDKKTSELEALEARIREMEEKLKSQYPAAAVGSSAQPSQIHTQTQHVKSRPGTMRQSQQAPGSGAMPPTPIGSEGELDSPIEPASPRTPRAPRPSEQPFFHVATCASSGDDAASMISIQTVSETSSYTDFVLVAPNPDGDRERGH